MDARSAGINGINAGSNGVAHAAQEMAELNARDRTGIPGTDRPGNTASPSNAVDALTDLRVYQRQVQASAVVVQTADAVVGFLLDVHA